MSRTRFLTRSSLQSLKTSAEEMIVYQAVLAQNEDYLPQNMTRLAHRLHVPGQLLLLASDDGGQQLSTHYSLHECPWPNRYGHSKTTTNREISTVLQDRYTPLSRN